MNHKRNRVLSAILAGLMLTSVGSTVLAQETPADEQTNQADNVSPEQKITTQQPDTVRTLITSEAEAFDLSLESLVNAPHTWGIDHGQVDNATGKLSSQLTGRSVAFLNKLETLASSGKLIDGSLLQNLEANGEAVKVNFDPITVPFEESIDPTNEAQVQASIRKAWETVYSDLISTAGAFLHDHPEVFYFSGKVSSGYEASFSAEEVIFKPYLAFDYAEVYQDKNDRMKRSEDMNAKIDEITNAVKDQSPVEQLNYFNAWLTMNNRYNPLLPNEPSTAHEATSALLSNSAQEEHKNEGPVCEGYAKAMKLLCEEVGIPCAIPIGHATADDANFEAHMWNYVKLDGNWYAIDPTWNDPVYTGNQDLLGLKDYFLVGSETTIGELEFSQGHLENGVIFEGYKFVYPTISNTAHKDAKKNYLIPEQPVRIINQNELKIGSKISEVKLSEVEYFMLKNGRKTPIAGTFSWDNPNQVLAEGTNTLTWKFTPTDTNLDCFDVTGSFTVKIGKESGTEEAGYVEPEKQTIAYQEDLKLSDVTLPERWKWSNPGTPLSVGTAEYEATYTPADPNNYNPVSKKIAVTVTQGTLTLGVSSDVNTQITGKDVKLTIQVAENKAKTLPTANDIKIKATNAVQKSAVTAVAGKSGIFEATFTVDKSKGDTAEFTVSVQNSDYELAEKTIQVQITDLLPGTEEKGYTDPENLSIEYTPGLTLKKILLPEGWSWDNPETSLIGGIHSYPATYTPKDTTTYAPVKKELSVSVVQKSFGLKVESDETEQWDGKEVTLTITLAENQTKALPGVQDIKITAANAEEKTPLQATENPLVFTAVYTVHGENGKKASFTVTAGNDEYATQEQTIQVNIKETYTCSITNAPTTVSLGQDIDISNVKLTTKYGSGKADTTHDINLGMLTGYDKTATGVDSIGKKTITIKVDDYRSATFSITVEDVVKDVAVQAPTKLTYDRSEKDTTLDLSGGTVAAVMQSQIPQTPVSITEAMLTMDSDLFDKAGRYPVSVSYQGIVKKDAFTITVMDVGSEEEGYQVPTVKDIAYQEGLTLKDISLPEQWSWESPDTKLSVGQAIPYRVVYTPKDPELYHPVTVKIPVTVVQGTLNLTVTADKTSPFPEDQVKLTITIADSKTKTLPTAENISIKATNAAQKGAVTPVDGKPGIFEAIFTITGKETETATFEVSVGNDDYTITSKQLELTIQEDTCTNTLIGAPSSVKLGEEIDVTGMQLKTTYKSGKPETILPVTLAMLSGYDKTATGENSIGQKTITVKADEKRYADFEITVEDVLKDIEVTSPKKQEYTWSVNGTTLDLTGATVTPIMQSQIEQPAVALSQDMLDITEDTLNIVGKHSVAVTYQGITKKDAFTITVNPVKISLDQQPSKDQPFASVEELEGVNLSGASLIVSSVDEKFKEKVADIQQELEELKQQIISFSVRLVDQNNITIDSTGKVTVTIPYPKDTSKEKFVFTLYKLTDDTTRTLAADTVEVACTTTENGIQFTEETAGDLGNYIITYKTKNSGDSTGTPGYGTISTIAGSWKQNAIGWWYEYADGTYPVNRWELIHQKWYHFDNNGYMQTGWIATPSGWYYLNTDGSMTTGWQFIGDTWYYMNEYGTMLTGWQQVNGKWYYLNEQGAMQTGWVFLNQKWYLLEQSGAMLTGWHWVGDKCYYMDQSGAMAASITTPDGFQVDDSGAWIQNIK